MIMTMAVVKLSSTEDMIKVIKAMIHNNFRLLRVVIWSVIKVNPLCVSIHSTIVIAPSR